MRQPFYSTYNGIVISEETSTANRYVLLSLSSLVIFCLVVLVGWVTNNVTLIHIHPSFSGMNPTTSLSLITLAVALLFAFNKQHFKWSCFLSKPLAGLVSLFTVARVIDITLSDQFGIDLLIFSEQVASQPTPSRMAVATAVSLFAVSLSIVLFGLRPKRIVNFIIQSLLYLSLSVAIPAIFFYAIGAQHLLEIPLYFSMAIHTAVGVFFLASSALIVLKQQYKTKLVLLDPLILAFLFFWLIPLWQYAVVPHILKLSTDFTYQAEVFSLDNFFDEEKNEFSGLVRSNTSFGYEVADKDGTVLTVKNFFDVKTPSGEPIFSVERLYGIDQFTQEHVAGFGDHDRTGFIFGPLQANGENFTYWHVNYDEPATMIFQEVVEIGGLTVHRYEANYHADQTENLSHLPDVGERRGVNLDINLQLWIEPTTGHLVKYEDATVAYYYDLETGRRLVPWNSFSNTYSSSAVEKQVSNAQEKIQELVLLRRVVPWSLFVLGALFAMTFILGKYRKKVFVRILPLLVLILALGTTYFMWRFATFSVNRQARTKFEAESNIIKNLVLDRMEIYSNALQGGVGLFESSDEVDRSEWQRYVEAINVQKNYPGVQGFGFAKVLQPDEVAEFEAEVQAEGFPDFAVFPDDEREIYTSIQFLEPFDFRNQRAFGYDMFSQETRRQAMEYARDTNDVSITGKVLLLQETEEDIQPGFLMYVPLYKDTKQGDSVDDRIAAIDGYVYSPFRMHDFIKAALFNQTQEINFEVYDGEVIESAAIMFDNSEIEKQEDPRFSKTETVDIFGHTWTFKYETLPDFGLGTFQESYPILVARVGILFSLLLSLITYALATSQARAVVLAEKITKDLKIKTQDLEQQKSQDEAILESIGDGLMATDEQGNIILVNQVFTEILGWEDTEVLGKPMTDVIGMFEQDGSEVAETNRPLSRALKKGEKVSTANKLYLKKDGEKIPVDITVTPIMVEGKIVGIIEIFRDITQEKEVDRMKTEFLSLASHQLRTPLSAIKWFIEMLLDSSVGKLTKKQHEIVEKVQVSNDRMIELVNSLLNVSRLEQGRIIVEPESTDIVALLDEVLTELTPALHERKQEVIKNITLENTTLDIDPKLVREIYLNLLTNASKYSPSETTITISMQVVENNVQISVADNGYGVPEEEVNSLFSKFYRASNVTTKETDGNGLGLYIVEQLVEVSGGKIWHEQNKPQGSIFTFTLPLAGSKSKEGEKSLE